MEESSLRIRMEYWSNGRDETDMNNLFGFTPLLHVEVKAYLLL